MMPRVTLQSHPYMLNLASRVVHLRGKGEGRESCNGNQMRRKNYRPRARGADVQGTISSRLEICRPRARGAGAETEGAVNPG